MNSVVDGGLLVIEKVIAKHLTYSIARVGLEIFDSGLPLVVHDVDIRNSFPSTTQLRLRVAPLERDTSVVDRLVEGHHNS